MKYKLLFKLSIFCIGFLMFTIPALTKQPKYNPAIHVYEEGIEQGMMKDHIHYGTLEMVLENTKKENKSIVLIPKFSQDNIQPQSVESGSWFYPIANNSGTKYTKDRVRLNSCGGGDDAWVDFYYINENHLWNNNIKVSATNPASYLHI